MYSIRRDIVVEMVKQFLRECEITSACISAGTFEKGDVSFEDFTSDLWYYQTMAENDEDFIDILAWELVRYEPMWADYIYIESGDRSRTILIPWEVPTLLTEKEMVEWMKGL